MAEEEKDGVWRTVSGRRIFIRNGQSLSDAMKESGKFEGHAKKNDKVVASVGEKKGSWYTDSDGKTQFVSDGDRPKVSSENKTLAVKDGASLRKRILADVEGKMTIDEIVNDPIIDKAEKKFTVPKEKWTSNINTSEREKIRRKAADEINSRGSISGKGEFKGEVKREYRAEIVIGAPAGGKSSVIVDKVSKNTKSRVLDSDEIKALLPEFGDGNGAGKVHTESADVILSGMVMPEYYKGGSHAGDNIVIPIVGKSPKNAQQYLRQLKAAGYKVHLSFNDVTLLNSAKRATTRYIETGRFLSPGYIQSIGDGPQKTYELLKKEGGFDSYSKYDNNVPFGQPAKKVERLDSKGNKLNWEDWQ